MILYRSKGNPSCHDDTTLSPLLTEAILLVVRERREEQWAWISDICGCGADEGVWSDILGRSSDTVVNTNVKSLLRKYNKNT